MKQSLEWFSSKNMSGSSILRPRWPPQPNQTLMEQSLDGPLPKLCPAVALSHLDSRHSAVALLLKAALIQVSDYRLLGTSGLALFTTRTSIQIINLVGKTSCTRMGLQTLQKLYRLPRGKQKYTCTLYTGCKELI